MKEKIHALVENALKKEKIIEKIEIEEPKDKAHGDFACNIALKLTKKLGIPPRELAEKIVKNIEKPDFIDEITIEGPGFINFKFSKKWLLENLQEIIEKGDKYGQSGIGKGKTVVTDTSHPNIAKPMGVHHLLSTIIGNSLNRILAFCEYKVIKDSYIGDWGTQFGKLIYAYKTWGDEKIVKKDPIKELLKLYVKFHSEAEKDPSLDEEGRKEFKKLEEGDSENKKLWKWIVDLSWEEFEKVYKILDVKFDVVNGESFYEDKMQKIIDLGISKKVFVEGEKGALICQFENEKWTPLVIRKSDGATLYATRDLARIDYWEKTWKPELMINVVDTAQEFYFKQLIEASNKLKLTNATQVHVSFGRMQFPGTAMSTRKGNIVLLEEVLDEAIKRARKIVEEKNQELSNEEKDKVAHEVGIGAVKYSVLSQNRNTNVIFTWDKMLALDGNSAPYLQYSHARACSILRKAQDSCQLKVDSCQLNEYEAKILRHLTGFQEAIRSAAEEYKPNLLANYLYELTQEFNNFYNQVPVLQAEKEEEKNLRLKLVKAVIIVLKTGLNLLGLEAPERM